MFENQRTNRSNRPLKQGGRRYSRSPEQQAIKDKYPHIWQWYAGKAVGCWLGGNTPVFCYDQTDPSKDCKHMYPSNFDRNKEDLDNGGDGCVDRCLFVAIAVSQWNISQGIEEGEVTSMRDVDFWQYQLDVIESRKNIISTIKGWNEK